MCLDFFYGRISFKEGSLRNKWYRKKTGQQNTNRTPTKADRKLTIQSLKETSRFDKVDIAENRAKIFS